MRYFALSPDVGISDMPHPADFHDKLDVRNLTRGKAGALPSRTLVRIAPNANTVFPEVLCSPVFLVTEEVKDVIKSYDEYIEYKQIMYMDTVNELAQLYHMPVLDFVDCLSERHGGKTVKTTIRKAPIRDKSIFRAPGAAGPLTIIRMDLAESLLARDFNGFRLSEITIEN
jgi:hypothetical protein